MSEYLIQDTTLQNIGGGIRAINGESGTYSPATMRTKLNGIKSDIDDSYTAVSGKGGTLPSAQNSANLPAAIESIPSGKPEQSKTLTLGASAPSTVTPDSGKVLSSVPVVLDTSVIKAENIAKDVTMLGVTGTHEGGGGGETWVFNMGIMDYLYGVNRIYIFRFRFIGNQTTENYKLLFPGDGTMHYQYKQTNGDVDNLVDGVPFSSIEPILYGAQGVILDYPASGNILTLLQNIATKQ